jgi:preprotein translocase SecF subunit
MRIFENASFNFLGSLKKSYVISGVLLLISLVSLFYPGLEFGIDFKGGTEFVVQNTQPVGATEARGALREVLGDGTEVKEYGDANTLLVRTATGGNPEELETGVLSALSAAFPEAGSQIVRIDSVGPRIASDLKSKAFLLVFGALFVILLYIFVRFDWRYAVSAVLCLAHDVFIVLGLFALLHNVTPFSLQIDQTIIAALLTIVGYSINDTVVVYDRIREYATIFKTEPFAIVANRAINTTLSRTLLTSGTTLLTVFVLFLFGGEVLRGFALALLVGIGVGTYSSIFVASPLVVRIREKYAPARRAIVARA